MPRSIVIGAAAGAGWGVVMRAWMRYITESPEFSWSGTLFIVGAATVVGALLGLARARRRSGGVGWWRLTALSLALLGAGGAVMWPAVVTGAVAFGRPRPRWLRWLTAAAAIVFSGLVLRDVAFDNTRLTTVEAVVASVWYAPMIGLEAWAFSVVTAPNLAPVPSKVKKTLTVVPVAFMIAAGVMAMGISG